MNMEAVNQHERVPQLEQVGSQSIEITVPAIFSEKSHPIIQSRSSEADSIGRYLTARGRCDRHSIRPEAVSKFLAPISDEGIPRLAFVSDLVIHIFCFCVRFRCWRCKGQCS